MYDPILLINDQLCPRILWAVVLSGTQDYRSLIEDLSSKNLMLDGTYLSRNFATLEPWISAAMCFLFLRAAAGIGFKVKANSLAMFRLHESFLELYLCLEVTLSTDFSSSRHSSCSRKLSTDRPQDEHRAVCWSYA